jgi:hypothetical protein
MEKTLMPTPVWPCASSAAKRLAKTCRNAFGDTNLAKIAGVHAYGVICHHPDLHLCFIEIRNIYGNF